MSKKSLQKKVAVSHEYITREIEKEMVTELSEIEKNSNAKIEKKYPRQNYPHHSRSHYVT
jgi:hypothetical protein